MQNSKPLILIGLIMVLATVLLNHSVTRFSILEPHRRPIETFPGQIGDWSAGPVRPVDPEVQAKLPTAKIVDRVYTNKAGEEIDLSLVTANTYDDLHHPEECFPDQGWTVRDDHEVQVNGQPLTDMLASKDGETIEVLHWLAAEAYPVQTPLQKITILRSAYMAANRHPADGRSIFVRLIASKTESSHEMLLAFARQIMEPLKQLSVDKISHE